MKELIKHIPVVSYIDGISTLGRDINILTMNNGETIEITNDIVREIHNRVLEKMKEYKFSFKSADGNNIIVLKDRYYNSGRSKAYELAFKELVLNEKVIWSEIIYFDLSDEIQFNF